MEFMKTGCHPRFVSLCCSLYSVFHFEAKRYF